MQQPDYKHLLESMDSALIELNDRLEFIYLNPAAEMLLATSNNQLNGRTVEDYCGKKCELQQLARQTLSSGQTITRRELSITMAGDRELTVNLTITALSGERGILLEIHPIGRLYSIAQETVRQEEYAATRLLLRGLAHEIKNPLGGIRGAAQLLEGEFEDQELKSYTEIIINETDRLKRLIDRMIGPRHIPQEHLINIHEISERVVQLIEAEASQGVRVVRDYDPSIPEIRGDSDQLIQAVLNIARNALEAIMEADEEGEIRFVTRIMRNYTIGGQQKDLVVRLTISDTGPGIPRNLQNQVFFPLISSKISGSGLGLSVSQAIVTSHGGIIKFESTRGATSFDILLPL
ncbi:MAG TPA: PAS domain S-box protein [Gammaproteobacteria bacterium]|nr:PAS domain S-box protein [Gammaproteobacteria bacterium]